MSLFTYPKFQSPDLNGLNLSGGKVYFYISGTTTPKDTYSDDILFTKNTNPVILNSRGEADIYLDGEYKVILKDADDAEIWTADNFSIFGDSEAIKSYANIAALRAITAVPSITDATIRGYYADGDGGSGFIYWDAVSTETDNGATIFKATVITTGRWKRNLPGVLSVKQAGAKGNGSTDDTLAIQAAIDAIAIPGGIVFLPEGNYITTDQGSGYALLIVNHNVKLHGEGGLAKGNNAIEVGSTIIKYNSTSGSCLKLGAGVFSLYGTEVKGITFAGTQDGRFYFATNTSIGIELDKANQMTVIRDCGFVLLKTGIHAHNSSLLNRYINNSYYYSYRGIELLDVSNSSTVAESQFGHCTYGILVQDSNDIGIRDNEFIRCTSEMIMLGGGALSVTSFKNRIETEVGTSAPAETSVYDEYVAAGFGGSYNPSKKLVSIRTGDENGNKTMTGAAYTGVQNRSAHFICNYFQGNDSGSSGGTPALDGAEYAIYATSYVDDVLSIGNTYRQISIASIYSDADTCASVHDTWFYASDESFAGSKLPSVTNYHTVEAQTLRSRDGQTLAIESNKNSAFSQGIKVSTPDNDSPSVMTQRMSIPEGNGSPGDVAVAWTECYHEHNEVVSDPSAPSANKGRAFFRDNGAGKTQYAVRFPTGAIQIIATEP